MPSLTTTEAADLFRQAPHQFLDVGAGEVAYRRVGSGPDVLFVHGWPVSGATFRRLLPHLADFVTCHIIDLPGAGASRFDAATPISVQQHIQTVRHVTNLLGFGAYAVVGHDSGGLIARHAIAGDARVRAVGLIDTEHPGRLGWRFRSFLATRRVPGIGGLLGWALARPAVRRNGLVLGKAFADPTLLDGEFDEFFLRPICHSAPHQDAAVRLLRSFDLQFVRDLPAVHRQIQAPVQLVWGELDAFFPLGKAEEMVATFSDARLAVVHGAGLFSHEERPQEVAAALLPALTG